MERLYLQVYIVERSLIGDMESMLQQRLGEKWGLSKPAAQWTMLMRCFAVGYRESVEVCGERGGLLELMDVKNPC